MSQETWTAVDEYVAELLVGTDSALDGALAANAAAGLPAIDVAPCQGKFLHLLVRMCGARRVLEIGTLGGYSTIWLARGLSSDGRLVTLEADGHHVQVAEANIKRAGLDGMVEIRRGQALDSLEDLVREGVAPFDFIFIDADKPNNPRYLEMALRLARKGTVLVGDNVVREGAILDAESADAKVRGVQSFFAMMGKEPRLSATALQTVGSKGYDGFAMALVIADDAT